MKRFALNAVRFNDGGDGEAVAPAETSTTSETPAAETPAAAE